MNNVADRTITIFPSFLLHWQALWRVAITPYPTVESHVPEGHEHSVCYKNIIEFSIIHEGTNKG